MKKNIKNIIIFLLLVCITFYVLLHDQNLSDLINILKKIDIKFLILGLISMFLFILGEGINTKLLLKEFGYNKSYLKTLFYAIVGFFYSSITPSASGGQPMQIYYMQKDKISPSSSTLILLIELCAFQFVSLIYLIIGIILNYNLLIQNIHGIGIIFVIGIIISIIVLLCLICLIFSKKVTNFIIKKVISLIKFLKFKNASKIEQTLETEKKNYQESADFIKNNKKIFIKVLIVTFFQLTFYFLIAYLIYRAFGLKEENLLKIITLEAVMFSSTSSLPLPGAIGASEGGFKMIFKPLFGSVLIDSAVILFRFTNFYFYVLLSSIIICIFTLKKKNIANV